MMYNVKTRSVVIYTTNKNESKSICEVNEYLQLGDEQFLGAAGVAASLLDSGFCSALVTFGFGCK